MLSAVNSARLMYFVGIRIGPTLVCSESKLYSHSERNTFASVSQEVGFPKCQGNVTLQNCEKKVTFGCTLVVDAKLYQISLYPCLPNVNLAEEMGDEATNPTMYCGHCKKDVPVANFTMHEVHCRRNIVICPRCNDSVPQKELSEHEREVHAAEACSKCGEQIEKRFLEEHMADECPKRNRRCEFCEIEFAVCDFAEHVAHCGSRTEPCVKCKQRVRLRDMSHHKCLTETNSANQEKVCIYCGRTVGSSAYEQHVDGCGSTEALCDSCQLPVLMRDMAAHLGSECTSHAIHASHIYNRIGVPSASFSFKPSINGAAFGAEQDDESSALGAIKQEFRTELPSRSFVPGSRQPIRISSGRVGVGRSAATGANSNGGVSRSSFLPQQSGSHRTPGSSANPGHTIRKAFPSEHVHTGASQAKFASMPISVPVYGDKREMAPSPGEIVTPTDFQLAGPATPSVRAGPRRNESSAAAAEAKYTSLPVRNVPVRFSPIESSSSNRILAPPVKSAELIKIPVQHRPAASFNERRQPPASSSQAKGGDMLADLSRPDDAVGAEPSDAECIPCQICGDIFPVDLLRDHQTFCGVLDEHGRHVLENVFGKDIAGHRESAVLHDSFAFAIPNTEGSLFPGSSEMPKANYTPTTAEEVELPCQFCERPFTSRELNAHQATCRSQLEYRSLPPIMGPPRFDQLDAGDDEEFCNYCLIAFPRSARHENSCPGRFDSY